MNSSHAPHAALATSSTTNSIQRALSNKEWEELNTLRLEKIQLEQKIEQLRRDDLRIATERNSFVLVLVDGDAAPFLDLFVEAGVSGGESAARVLHSTIFKYVSGSLGVNSEFRMMIRVYSKLEYLSKTYRQIGVLHGHDNLQAFVQGFNRALPLCDYVDAGNDKEGADRKVQDLMKLFLDNVHCKHIILCASQDNSYTGFLRQFVHHGKVNRGITLVQGIPFPRDLAELSTRFLNTQFPNVFRSSKITTRAVLKEEGLGTGLSSTRKPTTLVTVSKDTPLLQASIRPNEAGVVDTTNGEAQPRPIPPDIATTKRLVSVLVHRHPFLRLTEKWLHHCRQHILGTCPYPPDECIYSHDGKPSGREFAALDALSEILPCQIGCKCSRGNHFY